MLRRSGEFCEMRVVPVREMDLFFQQTFDCPLLDRRCARGCETSDEQNQMRPHSHGAEECWPLPWKLRDSGRRDMLVRYFSVLRSVILIFIFITPPSIL